MNQAIASVERRAAPPWRTPAIAAPRVRAANANWDPLLACVAAYIVMSVGRVHQLFPPLGALRPMIAAGGLAVALYAFDRSAARRLARALVPTTRYLIAFTAWMAVCVAASLWPGNSFELFFGNFIKTAVFFLVVVGSVRGVRDVERLAFMYLLAATIYACVVVVRFDLGGDAWRVNDLYYYDSNDFATFAVSAMPFGLYFLHAARRGLTRIFAGGAVAILALGIVYTGSRGGFIALAAMAGFIVLRYTGIALRWRMSATAVIAATLLFAASDRYWEEMSTILSDADYNRTEESGRLQIWRRGVGYMLQYPVFGVGPANFQTAEGRLSPHAQRQQMGIGVRWNAAHNSFIQAGAELGIPGLLLFTAVVAGAFGALRRSRRARGPKAGRRTRLKLTQATTASLIGFTVGACFLSLAYSEMLYTLAALAAALHKTTVVPERLACE